MNKYDCSCKCHQHGLLEVQECEVCNCLSNPRNVQPEQLPCGCPRPDEFAMCVNQEHLRQPEPVHYHSDNKKNLSWSCEDKHEQPEQDHIRDTTKKVEQILDDSDLNYPLTMIDEFLELIAKEKQKSYDSGYLAGLVKGHEPLFDLLNKKKI